MYLAKGGNLRQMVAELYGKASGSAKGKGGSMHLVDVASGIMGTSAVVATTIPHAVGYAYGLKLRHEKTVVVSFFGDGATDEGVYYESLNFASLKRLPVIFICENNGYAIMTHQRQRQPQSNIDERARTFCMPAERIDDDVLYLHKRVSAAVSSIRAGTGGPFFFECMTYRWKEHVGPNDDFELGFRSRAEAEPWFQNDQVKRLGGMLDPAKRAEIEQAVEAEICESFAFAEASPFPDAAELHTDLFDD
jgi:TPP-dependent pyruvate/acetoin dehydrogenase alpha subunit